MLKAYCSHLLLALLVVRQVDQAVSAIPNQVDHLVPAHFVYDDQRTHEKIAAIVSSKISILVTFEAPLVVRQLLRE